jgi:hypothetical protein
MGCLRPQVYYAILCAHGNLFILLQAKNKSITWKSYKWDLPRGVLKFDVLKFDVLKFDVLKFDAHLY